MVPSDDDDQQELELAEVETQARRIDNKRKRLDEPKKPEERKKKEKKRKFEKLVNWGELCSIQEEGDHPQEPMNGQMEDWLVRQEERRRRGQGTGCYQRHPSISSPRRD